MDLPHTPSTPSQLARKAKEILDNCFQQLRKKTNFESLKFAGELMHTPKGCTVCVNFTNKFANADVECIHYMIINDHDLQHFELTLEHRIKLYVKDRYSTET